MTPAIVQGGVASMLTREADAAIRIEALARKPGFDGGVLLRAVGPFKKAIAYVRWSDADSAAAHGGGVPLRTIDVRQKRSPLDRHPTIPLTRGGDVVLALRWEVDPERCDALLAELQDFTDAYLPTAHGVIATAFHVSDDRTIVAEYLQARNVWTMIRIQFGLPMRRHQRKVKEFVKATDIGLYRVERVVEAR